MARRGGPPRGGPAGAEPEEFFIGDREVEDPLARKLSRLDEQLRRLRSSAAPGVAGVAAKGSAGGDAVCRDLQGSASAWGVAPVQRGHRPPRTPAKLAADDGLARSVGASRPRPSAPDPAPCASAGAPGAPRGEAGDVGGTPDGGEAADAGIEDLATGARERRAPSASEVSRSRALSEFDAEAHVTMWATKVCTGLEQPSQCCAAAPWDAGALGSWKPGSSDWEREREELAATLQRFREDLADRDREVDRLRQANLRLTDDVALLRAERAERGLVRELVSFQEPEPTGPAQRGRRRADAATQTSSPPGRASHPAGG